LKSLPVWCVAAGLLAGCATLSAPPSPQPLRGAAVELTDVPFFAQKRYQCGPAALATALGASGRSVTPDALTPEVYLPDRKGSLQAELIAATRRQDRVAVRIDGGEQALVDQLQAGQPVLVLLNLGFSWLPVWHYAVVVGYQPDDDRFILRSGTERRKRMSRAALTRSWAYSDEWAIVVTSLDRIPAAAQADAWLTAVAPLESLGRLDLAEQGYRAALARWPDAAMAWTALGNVEARRAQWRDAVDAYSRALTLRDDAVTRNNRANALGELQCRTLAIDDLDQATRLDTERRFANTLAATRAGLPLRDACQEIEPR
jgi:tetratricopeptide (TPR) repeat protein